MKNFFLKFVFAFFLFSFFSCKETQVVVEKRDSVVFRNKIDTIIVVENNFIDRYQKGETIFVERTKELLKEKISIKTDTIYNNVEKPIIQEVTKEITPKWCWYLLFGAVFFVLIFFLKFLLKVIKK